MKNEFREAYINLFDNSFSQLRKMIHIKLKAINYSNKYLLRDNSANYKAFGKMREGILQKNI